MQLSVYVHTNTGEKAVALTVMPVGFGYLTLLLQYTLSCKNICYMVHILIDEITHSI